MHLQPEAVSRRRLAPDLYHALGIAGEAKPAIALPTGGLTRLGLQAIIELDAVFQQLGDVGGGAQLSHQARGMPGGAAGELVALQQQDIPPAQLGEVVSSAAADDAAADDD